MFAHYGVWGTAELAGRATPLRITGNVVIDSVLRQWEPSCRGQGEPASLPLECQNYCFAIHEYSLVLFSHETSQDLVYHFSGTAGSLYMVRPAGGYMSDLMWYLMDGSGDWSYWEGEHFKCFRGDLSEHDLYNELQDLAPFIRLDSLMDTQGDPNPSLPMQTHLWLARIGTESMEAVRPSPPRDIRIIGKD